MSAAAESVATFAESACAYAEDIASARPTVADIFLTGTITLGNLEKKEPCPGKGSVPVFTKCQHILFALHALFAGKKIRLRHDGWNPYFGGMGGFAVWLKE